MTRGTTPTITISTDTDLTEYAQIWLTIRDKIGTEITIDKTGMTVSTDGIAAALTQAQTLELSPGPIVMQIRALDVSGKATASEIIHTTLAQIIKDGEISV